MRVVHTPMKAHGRRELPVNEVNGRYCLLALLLPPPTERPAAAPSEPCAHASSANALATAQTRSGRPQLHRIFEKETETHITPNSIIKTRMGR